MIPEQQYLQSAAALGCEVEAIKAVSQVESSGGGFLANNDCKILFEPHVFWRLLEKKGILPQPILNKKPDLKNILYEKWGTYPYGKQSSQWTKLKLAATIDEDCAYQSASYGRFQILGLHFKACCFPTIQAYVAAMCKIDPAKKNTEQDESAHLAAFCNFLFSQNLHTYLKEKNWSKFALRYNGSGYKQGTPTIIDDYDYKLSQAYNKLIAKKNG